MSTTVTTTRKPLPPLHCDKARQLRAAGETWDGVQYLLFMLVGVRYTKRAIVDAVHAFTPPA